MDVGRTGAINSEGSIIPCSGFSMVFCDAVILLCILSPPVKKTGWM